MSVYFNQTNITSGTPFASGGGDSNFPQGINVGTNPTTVLAVEGVAGIGCLAAKDYITDGLAPFQVAQLFTGGLGYPYAGYGVSSISYYTSGGGQTSFLNVDETALGSTPPFALSNISTINGAAYAGANFPLGITFGTSNGLMSLSSFNTTTAVALLQGTVGNDPQLIIGTANNNINLAQDDISFFDTVVGGTVDFAAYGGGAKILVSNLQSINGLAVVGDWGADTKATSSGNATLDGAGQANIVLTDTYRDSNSYSVLTTKLGAAPTITPWVTITDSNAFTINGDAAADISWLSIGLI